MKTIFITGLYPTELQSEIQRNSKGIIDNAANSLQWNFVKGLDHYCKIKLINLPFVGSYPFLYKKAWIPTFHFEHIKGASDVNIGFFNLSIIKNFIIYSKLKKELRKTISASKTIKTVIIYSIHSATIKAATEVKALFPEIQICLIVPDLPQFKSDKKNKLFKLLSTIDSSISKRALSKVDSFVFLTDSMNEELNRSAKSWVRIEGMFTPLSHPNIISKESNKTILYTGTLANRYGIMNLLEAFKNIQGENYRLWICGEGDCRQEIESTALLDKRIIYFGQLDQKKVLELQKKATLLINPRTSEGLFTKYSFPSKILEYLGSGTPTIMHKLLGIPEEYFEYCFVAKEENAKGLAKAIMIAFDKTQEELDEFGERAAQFIAEHKNPVEQVRKLHNMINT